MQAVSLSSKKLACNRNTSAPRLLLDIEAGRLLSLNYYHTIHMQDDGRLKLRKLISSLCLKVINEFVTVAMLLKFLSTST